MIAPENQRVTFEKSRKGHDYKGFCLAHLSHICFDAFNHLYTNPIRARHHQCDRWMLYCVLLLWLGGMWGCLSQSGSRRSSPALRGRAVFQLEQRAPCLRFCDYRTGLQFCVPPGTKLQIARRFDPTDQGSFEVRVLLTGRQLELRLRKDQLPPDLPEGALSGAWLLRYAEVYAASRGAPSTQIKKRLLPPQYQKFLRVDAAVWAAFPRPRDPVYRWEEILVLAREAPPTRYLLSVRLSQAARQDADALRRFFQLFLEKLRLSPRSPPPQSNPHRT